MTIIDWDETMLRQIRPEPPKPSDPEMTQRDVDAVVENGRLRRMLGREGRPGGRTYDEENPAWGVRK